MQKNKFNTSQILSSKRFSNTDKYLIEAILDKEKQYSLAEVEKLILKEKKRGVK